MVCGAWVANISPIQAYRNRPWNIQVGWHWTERAKQNLRISRLFITSTFPQFLPCCSSPEILFPLSPLIAIATPLQRLVSDRSSLIKKLWFKLFYRATDSTGRIFYSVQQGHKLHARECNICRHSRSVNSISGTALRKQTELADWLAGYLKHIWIANKSTSWLTFELTGWHLG